jgi:hypothetical protein
MAASFFVAVERKVKFLRGLTSPSSKHLIGFQRGRREAVFL